MGYLLRLVSPYALGLLLPLFVFGIFYAGQDALRDLASGVFVTPFRRLSLAARRPPPLLAMLPALLAAGILIVARRLSPRPRAVTAGVLAVLLVPLLVTEEVPGIGVLGWLSISQAIPITVLLGAIGVLQNFSEPSTRSLESQRLMLLITALALCGLVRFPWTNPTYFAYLAPLELLAVAAIVSSKSWSVRPVTAVFLVFYLIYAITWLTPMMYREHNDSADLLSQAPITTVLPGRAGLRVRDSAAVEYDSLISLVRARGAGAVHLCHPGLSGGLLSLWISEPDQDHLRLFRRSQGSHPADPRSSGGECRESRGPELQARTFRTGATGSGGGARRAVSPQLRHRPFHGEVALMNLVARALEHPLVYRAWQAPFEAAKLRPVFRHNDLSRVSRVLDVGCGPGTNAREFRHAEYLGVDINPRYVAEARRRYGREFVVGDVTAWRPPTGARFDFILVNSLLHHLDDANVRRTLATLRDGLSEGGHLHLLELVLPAEPGDGKAARARRPGALQPLAGALASALRRALRAGGVRALRTPGVWDRALEHDLLQGSSEAMSSRAERFGGHPGLQRGQAGLGELLRRVRAVLDAVPGGPHEVILVDDGSSDRTFALAEEASAADPRIPVAVSLSRNFGHQAALSPPRSTTRPATPRRDYGRRPPGSAGGDPALPRGAGAGVRRRLREAHETQGALASSSAAYWIFYRLMGGLSIQVPLDAGDFGLMSRRVVDLLLQRAGAQPVPPGAQELGRLPAARHSDRARRAPCSSTSKYSFRQAAPARVRRVFAFSMVPIRAAAIVGAFAMLASSLFALYSLLAKLVLGDSTRGFTALMLSDVPVRDAPALPRLDRGIPRAGLRGSEGKAPLRRGPDHRAAAR